MLYNAKKLRGAFTPDPTVGFQYEEVEASTGQGNDKPKAGFWDVGGSEACMNVMQAITQNVKFNAVLIVIDITQEIISRYGGVTSKGVGGKGKQLGYQNNIDFARKMIHRLLAEEEMRYVHTVAIVLNCRKESKLYKEIYDDSKMASVYLNKEEMKAEAKGEEDDPEAEKKKLKVSKKLASGKENSMILKEDLNFPFK